MKLNENNVPEIDPDSAVALWYALYAITNAVELIGAEEDVNQLRHRESGLGAHEYARLALATATKEQS